MTAHSLLGLLLSALLYLPCIPSPVYGEVPPKDLEEVDSKSALAGTTPQQNTANEDKPKPAVTHPSYQNVRSDEDWSVLRDSKPRTSYEKLKFIPLSDDGSTFLSLGGQLRLRGESWNSFGFGGEGNRDDSFGLLRLRMHGDFRLGKRFRIFAEGKSSLATDRDLPGGLRTLDVDTLDIQHLMLDVNLSLEQTRTAVRAGRQELQFGKQRLVSPLDWANTRRTWDAARFIAQGDNWRVDGFWSEFVQVHKYSLNCADDSGIDFYGIYSTNKIPAHDLTIDLYWLGYERQQSVWTGVSGRENRQTIGGRIDGKFSGQGFFDLEAAVQVGSVGESDVVASMFAGQIGYRFNGSPTAPRVQAGLDYGSGDGDPEDGKIGTLNQLFPLGHAYLGYIDIVGRQNIVDWNAGVSFDLHRKINLAFDLHNFWRASNSDALYNPGGAVVRAGNLADSSRIGSEIDITIKSGVNRNLLIAGGYSHFFSGPFIEESGPAEGIDFLYLMIQTTF